jgi:ribonuclease BN (tRNA processing enzyme)
MIRITMHQAGNGDCISIQTDEEFVLIDGGTAHSFDQWKKEIFDKVSTIDALIVTHIDNDHVNGIIKLLLDEKCPKINEIFFNGVEQIFENIVINSKEIDRDIERRLKAFASECDNIEATVPIGYSEGTSLSYLIKEKDISCNSIVFKEAIYREKLKDFYINTIRFITISPTQNDLNELKQSWIKNLDQKKIRSKIITKSYSEAFELYVKNIIDSHTENFKINATSYRTIESLANTAYIQDSVVPKSDVFVV